MESLYHQHLESTIFFFLPKNTHQKAANLMFCLILPAGLGYIKSFEVKYIIFYYPFGMDLLPIGN